MNKKQKDRKIDMQKNRKTDTKKDREEVRWKKERKTEKEKKY